MGLPNTSSLVLPLGVGMDVRRRRRPVAAGKKGELRGNWEWVWEVRVRVWVLVFVRARIG